MPSILSAGLTPISARHRRHRSGDHGCSDDTDAYCISSKLKSPRHVIHTTCSTYKIVGLTVKSMISKRRNRYASACVVDEDAVHPPPKVAIFVAIIDQSVA